MTSTIRLYRTKMTANGKRRLWDMASLYDWNTGTEPYNQITIAERQMTEDTDILEVFDVGTRSMQGYNYLIAKGDVAEYDRCYFITSSVWATPTSLLLFLRFDAWGTARLAAASISVRDGVFSRGFMDSYAATYRAELRGKRTRSDISAFSNDGGDLVAVISFSPRNDATTVYKRLFVLRTNHSDRAGQSKNLQWIIDRIYNLARSRSFSWEPPDEEEAQTFDVRSVDAVYLLPSTICEDYETSADYLLNRYPAVFSADVYAVWFLHPGRSFSKLYRVSTSSVAPGSRWCVGNGAMYTTFAPSPTGQTAELHAVMGSISGTVSIRLNGEDITKSFEVIDGLSSLSITSPLSSFQNVAQAVTGGLSVLAGGASIAAGNVGGIGAVLAGGTQVAGAITGEIQNRSGRVVAAASSRSGILDVWSIRYFNANDETAQEIYSFGSWFETSESSSEESSAFGVEGWAYNPPAAFAVLNIASYMVSGTYPIQMVSGDVVSASAIPQRWLDEIGNDFRQGVVIEV